jgi:hypothetical protein
MAPPPPPDLPPFLQPVAAAAATNASEIETIEIHTLMDSSSGFVRPSVIVARLRRSRFA